MTFHMLNSLHQTEKFNIRYTVAKNALYFSVIMTLKKLCLSKCTLDKLLKVYIPSKY